MNKKSLEKDLNKVFFYLKNKKIKIFNKTTLQVFKIVL